jgi:hypothetical protein
MNIVRPPKPPMVEEVSASEAVEVGSKTSLGFRLEGVLATESSLPSICCVDAVT